MLPFITGSHAYGTPTDKSDVDLVVRVDSLIADRLCRLAGEYTGVTSLRFGNLNLLLCRSDIEYNVWRKGTDELRERGPVTRDEAVVHFQNLRKQANIDLIYESRLEHIESGEPSQEYNLPSYES